MITRFITDVSTKFNPFSPRAKAARVFLSFLPPTARSDGMNITTKLLPRNSPEPSTLYVKFSTLNPSLGPYGKGQKEIGGERGCMEAVTNKSFNRGRQGDEHRLREAAYQQHRRGS